MTQPFFGGDPFVDSEDLMSWLLLNPEIDAFTENLGFPFTFPANNDQSNEFESQVNGLEQQYISSSNGNEDGYSMNGFLPMGEEASSDFNHNIGTDGAISSSVTIPKVKKENNNKREASPTNGRVAKIQRKRPRESLDDLENRVKELKAENADLHAHLLNVTQRTTEVQKQRVAMERLMASKLSEIEERRDFEQSELAEIVKQYTDLYADYGKCRQREVAFHLQQLEKLIVPTQTTKMCLWTLHQEKASPEPTKSTMFTILAKELEITPEQTEKILERREKINFLMGQLRESLDLLQALKILIEKKHACYDQICGRVQSAATPQQVVRFLMWITSNAEALAKYIQGFNRSIHHIPNVEFVNKFNAECSVQNDGDAANSSSK